MALKKCLDCGNRVSGEVHSCPACGSLNKKQSTIHHGCGLIFVAWAIGFVFCSIFFLVLVDIQLLPSPFGNEKEKPKNVNKRQSFPYKFLEAKRDGERQQNLMELFVYKGEFDVDNLKKFCVQKRRDKGRDMTSEDFYFAVIFDDADHAGFPATPFTKLYRSSLELEKDTEYLKHIRATYSFNKKNRFSRLWVYEDNAWESKFLDIEI